MSGNGMSFTAHVVADEQLELLEERVGKPLHYAVLFCSLAEAARFKQDNDIVLELPGNYFVVCVTLKEDSDEYSF
jgi:hypothetical protein